MDTRHQRYLNLLAKIASDVIPVGQARIAAGIVYKNNLISVGICRKKSHPFQAQFGRNKESIFLHAETDCIKNSLKSISLEELSRSTLYVCRVKYEDNTKTQLTYGLAKPCEGCQKAISNFDIRRIIYTLDNEGYEVL